MRVSSVILQKDFKKQFSKLNKKIQLEFEDRLRLLLSDQFHPILNSHPLHGEWEKYWSINITGDVRAIYITKDFTAIFVAIGTHSQLYGG